MGTEKEIEKYEGTILNYSCTESGDFSCSSSRWCWIREKKYFKTRASVILEMHTELQ
jgi:hypothetical protein